ncbi:MAG: amidohydrolase family protein [Acidobacteriaceae bacterium]
MAAVIDAHHHFWHYTPEEYGWIDDSMSLLRRTFLPENLAPEIQANGVDGVISVQARQTLGETHWLLEMAEQHTWIRAVVGWAPIIADDLSEHLDRLTGHRKLRALRHVLQAEADEYYMLRPDFNAGLTQLTQRGLAYDILIFERQLPQTIQFVDQHPNQIFVLDHIAKPRIAAAELSPWREQIMALARRENVYCKLSGMVTEANWTTWSSATLQPYLDTICEAFTPQRLLFGSDWPVCLLASSYAQWIEFVRTAIGRFTPAEQARIFGGTATEAYGL